MFTYLATTLKRSWLMFLAIAKIMIPVMIGVQVAQHFGLVDALGHVLGPAMGVLNLPAEAGIIWATSLLVGMYGGLASLSTLSGSLDLTAGQLSALAAMILFAHNIPVEQSIVRRAGASFSATALLRITTALVYGGAIAWISHLTGWLSEPISLDWLRGADVISDAPANGYWAWMQATAFSLMLTFVIILVLVVVLDIFNKLGITRRITSAITPALRFSGLDAQVAPVTTVGVLLGLSYGGALIIEESQRLQFSARTRFLALSWLSLSHSLIEDTILLMALGADIWVILVGRVLVTLAIVAFLARLTRSDRPDAVRPATLQSDDAG